MYIRKIAVLAILASILAVSCKDHRIADPDPEYLSGHLAFKAPSYCNAGDIVTLTPSGLEIPSGVDVGYYWKVTPLPAVTDTTRYLGDDASVTGAYQFEIPDTLTTLTVTCGAFANGYYTTTGTNYIVVVDPEKTITNVSTTATLSQFTDPRDGVQYEYFTSGNVDWFAENLRYAGSGASFVGCVAMDEIYGRYYTYDDAISACPDGWRLPDGTDWKNFAKALGSSEDSNLSFTGMSGKLMVDGYFNGERLWAYWPEVKVTNSTGFGSLPTGYAIKTSTENDFQGTPSYAAYWTAEEIDEERAVYRYIFVESPDVKAASGHKDNLLLSVRCVRNSIVKESE